MASRFAATINPAIRAALEIAAGQRPEAVVRRDDHRQQHHVALVALEVGRRAHPEAAGVPLVGVDALAQPPFDDVDLADAVEAVMSGRMRNGILVAGILAAAELLRRS